MPAERLSMRKVREVLRLLAKRQSVRQMARSLGMPRTTIRDYYLLRKYLGWQLFSHGRSADDVKVPDGGPDELRADLDRKISRFLGKKSRPDE